MIGPARARVRQVAVAASIGLLGAAACSSQRSLLAIDVTGEQSFSDVTLRISANGEAAKVFAHASFSMVTSFPAGVYLPAGVSGAVSIVGTADDGRCVTGTGMITVPNVQPGQSTMARLIIHPSDSCVPIADGGVFDAGSMDGGGGKDRSGAGGMVGAGAGGAAGTGGSGAGGAAGTGGSAAGTGGSGAGGRGTGGSGAGGFNGSCTPSVLFCLPNTNQVVRCSPNGAGATLVEDCAATQKACYMGACSPVICTPGVTICQDRDVVECNSRGIGYTPVTSCLPPLYCDTIAGTCKNTVCTPGQPACNGGVATTCNAIGSGYEAGGIDCATSSQLCSQGQCTPPLCPASQYYCEAGNLRLCKADSLSSVPVKTCTAAQFCNATAVTCSQRVCSAGSMACSTQSPPYILAVCNADGSAFTDVGGIDCGATGQVCSKSARACVQPMCAPDSYYCVRNFREHCGADGLSIADEHACAPTEYCDPVTSNCKTKVCMAGLPTCSGITAATCNDQGTAVVPESRMVCPTTCADGLCTDALLWDGFEDGQDWEWTDSPHGDISHTQSFPTPGANGSNRCLHQARVANGATSMDSGLYRTFAPRLLPASVGWWVRVSQSGQAAGYLSLHESLLANDVPFISVYFAADGSIYSNTLKIAPYVAGTWYHIQVRNIDWTARKFDLLVDGNQVQTGAYFMPPGAALGRIDVFNFDSGTGADWDEMEIR